MLNEILKVANEARESGDFRAFKLLSKVAVELGLVESHKALIIKLKLAHKQILAKQKQLEDAKLFKFAAELDVIARDLDAQIITFQAEDPISAVLDSYKIIHRIAKEQGSTTNLFAELSKLVESEELSDEQLIQEIKTKTLGLPTNKIMDTLYLLNKEYNLNIPLSKIADSSFEDIKTRRRRRIKQIIEQLSSLPKDEQGKFDFTASFPSQPHMWSGFAYQATVPYQQSNALNFWTLANNTRILKKISNKID
jgi:hypothetical protein